MTSPTEERRHTRAPDALPPGELDTFFEMGPELLCIRSLDGVLVLVKPPLAHLLGRTVEELAGHPVEDFMRREDAERSADVLLGLGPRDRAVVEERWTHADGSERTLAWSVQRSSEREVILAVGRDITPAKQRETALRRARLEAEEANRAKSEFLANMSHEIRTPMNGIIGMTELTLDTLLSDQQREYLQMVNASAGALLDTINSILDFSKIEAGKLELEQTDFTLWETVTGALKPLALTARNKGVELLYDEAPNIPERLRGDPGRLRQALVNLVGNAVKFTEEGSVRLSLERIRSAGPGYRLRFVIEDTGIGIPANKLEHVFGSFNQVDGSMSRRFGGTGLGLAITSGIVRMMGGTIEVVSEPGAGSTFSFEADFDDVTNDARSSRPEGTLDGLRVLAVDDHDANRRILIGFAERMGMQVTAASSGAEALTALREAADAGRPMQLALLDCQMPEMSGFELAERIREDPRFGDLVLVAFTAAGQPGDGARCEQLGIASYLLKPLAPAELRDALLMTIGKAADAAARGELVTRHSLREARLRLNVLVAEDNPVNQKLALHVLERFGHQAHLVTNGREAVEASAKGEYDVILMDIQMPEMDGIEATRRIRERETTEGRYTPIVAMTAHAMSGDRERFLEAGMDEYVSKPISRDRLREVLRGVGRTRAPTADPTSAPSPPSPAPDSSTSFDRAAFLKRADGDPELVRTLVDVLETDREKLLNRIDAAVEAGDLDALERAAHTLKGALSVFGAEEARARAEAIEFAARGGSTEEAASSVDPLKESVGRLSAELAALIEQLARG